MADKKIHCSSDAEGAGHSVTLRKAFRFRDTFAEPYNKFNTG